MKRTPGLTFRAVGTEGFDPIAGVDAELISAEQSVEQAENARRQEIEDFKWVVAHAPGRRFMWRMLALSGVYRQSAVIDSSNATFFNEGRRQLGLMLMGEFHEHSLEMHQRMVKEHNAS